MRASHKIQPIFDDPNLVGCAGLTPALLLGESAGLHDLLGEHLSPDPPMIMEFGGLVSVS